MEFCGVGLPILALADGWSIEHIIMPATVNLAPSPSLLSESSFSRNTALLPLLLFSHTLPLSYSNCSSFSAEQSFLNQLPPPYYLLPYLTLTLSPLPTNKQTSRHALSLSPSPSSPSSLGRLPRSLCLP